MIGVLLVAAGVSFAIGEGVEAGAILAIVVLNAILGFVQEWRAEQAMAALRSLAAPHAHVIRGAARTEVAAADLVVGDIYLHRTYYMGLVDAKNRLNLYDGTIRVVTPSGKEFANFPPSEYVEHIAEHVVKLGQQHDFDVLLRFDPADAVEQGLAQDFRPQRVVVFGQAGGGEQGAHAGVEGEQRLGAGETPARGGLVDHQRGLVVVVTDQRQLQTIAQGRSPAWRVDAGVAGVDAGGLAGRHQRGALAQQQALRAEIGVAGFLQRRPVGHGDQLALHVFAVAGQRLYRAFDQAVAALINQGEVFGRNTAPGLFVGFEIDDDRIFGHFGLHAGTVSPADKLPDRGMASALAAPLSRQETGSFASPHRCGFALIGVAARETPPNCRNGKSRESFSAIGKKIYATPGDGAGEGNRTLLMSLGSSGNATIRRPRCRSAPLGYSRPSG